MPFNFDEQIDRRASDSIKWNMYPADALPLWVADADFRVPPEVTSALHARVDHDIYGYSLPAPATTELLCARMQRLYGWDVTSEQIVFIPSLVTGIHAVCRAYGEPGGQVLMQPPVYPPFLTAPASHGQTAIFAPLVYVADGNTFRYEIDFAAFEAAITPQTKLFLLCHPHNPTGVEYSRADLLQLAEICERHDLIIASDEIHCDLLLGGTQHTPIASLSREASQRTVTMMAPSKTFNMPGLKSSFLIIQNEALRTRLQTAIYGIVPWVNLMGLTALDAAYRHGDEWLNELQHYLTANRDFMVKYIADEMPMLKVGIPNATYLAWIDCRTAGITGSPYTFFLEKAKVALSDGIPFGAPGEGFVRLNFGTTRATLQEALERMRNQLHDL